MQTRAGWYLAKDPEVERAEKIFNNDFSFAKWQELLEKASVFKAQVDGEIKSFETWEALEEAVANKEDFDYNTVTFEYKTQEQLEDTWRKLPSSKPKNLELLCWPTTMKSLI